MHKHWKGLKNYFKMFTRTQVVNMKIVMESCTLGTRLSQKVLFWESLVPRVGIMKKVVRNVALDSDYSKFDNFKKLSALV